MDYIHKILVSLATYIVLSGNVEGQSNELKCQCSCTSIKNPGLVMHASGNLHQSGSLGIMDSLNIDTPVDNTKGKGVGKTTSRDSLNFSSKTITKSTSTKSSNQGGSSNTATNVQNKESIKPVVGSSENVKIYQQFQGTQNVTKPVDLTLRGLNDMLKAATKQLITMLSKTKGYKFNTSLENIKSQIALSEGTTSKQEIPSNNVETNTVTDAIMTGLESIRKSSNQTGQTDPQEYIHDSTLQQDSVLGNEGMGSDFLSSVSGKQEVTVDKFTPIGSNVVDSPTSGMKPYSYTPQDMVPSETKLGSLLAMETRKTSVSKIDTSYQTNTFDAGLNPNNNPEIYIPREPVTQLDKILQTRSPPFGSNQNDQVAGDLMSVDKSYLGSLNMQSKSTGSKIKDHKNVDMYIPPNTSDTISKQDTVGSDLHIASTKDTSVVRSSLSMTTNTNEVNQGTSSSVSGPNAKPNRYNPLPPIKSSPVISNTASPKRGMGDHIFDALMASGKGSKETDGQQSAMNAMSGQGTNVDVSAVSETSGINIDKSTSQSNTAISTEVVSLTGNSMAPKNIKTPSMATPDIYIPPTLSQSMNILKEMSSKGNTENSASADLYVPPSLSKAMANLNVGNVATAKLDTKQNSKVNIYVPPAQSQSENVNTSPPDNIGGGLTGQVTGDSTVSLDAKTQTDVYIPPKDIVPNSNVASTPLMNHLTATSLNQQSIQTSDKILVGTETTQNPNPTTDIYIPNENRLASSGTEPSWIFGKTTTDGSAMSDSTINNSQQQTSATTTNTDTSQMKQLENFAASLKTGTNIDLMSQFQNAMHSPTTTSTPGISNMQMNQNNQQSNTWLSEMLTAIDQLQTSGNSLGQTNPNNQLPAIDQLQALGTSSGPNNPRNQLPAIDQLQSLGTTSGPNNPSNQLPAIDQLQSLGTTAGPNNPSNQLSAIDQLQSLGTTSGPNNPNNQLPAVDQLQKLGISSGQNNPTNQLPSWFTDTGSSNVDMSGMLTTSNQQFLDNTNVQSKQPKSAFEELANMFRQQEAAATQSTTPSVLDTPQGQQTSPVQEQPAAAVTFKNIDWNSLIAQYNDQMKGVSSASQKTSVVNDQSVTNQKSSSANNQGAATADVNMQELTRMFEDYVAKVRTQQTQKQGPNNYYTTTTAPTANKLNDQLALAMMMRMMN